MSSFSIGPVPGSVGPDHQNGERLPLWHKPGLLFIGDAAHAMSPVGGVGINYAIGDAVETANVLRHPATDRRRDAAAQGAVRAAAAVPAGARGGAPARV